MGLKFSGLMSCYTLPCFMMHFKKFVLVFFLFLFGMGIAFGQNDTTSDLEFNRGKIKFLDGVTLNVLKGYVAVNQDNTGKLIEKLGLVAYDNESVVSIMVPENLAMVPDQPYLVVIHYNGLVINPDDLANYSSEAIHEELILNKSTNPKVNWVFTSWIDSSANYDKDKHLLRINCVFKNRYNQNVKQRQLAYWQFCNQGTYHYVWICPEDKLDVYNAPVNELDKLLKIDRSNKYDDNLIGSNCEQSTTLTELVSREDLGSTSFNTNGTNPELEIKEQSEENEREERAPVFSNNLLIMFISNLTFWQLVFLCVVPAFVICMLILYNSSVYEPKEKEVNWDDQDES